MRLAQAPEADTSGYIIVVAPNGVSGSDYVEFTNTISGDCRFLHNDPTQPTGDTDSQAKLPVDADAPTATGLYNYDKERDGNPGLELDKTAQNVSETDPTKFQVWRTGALASDLVISGDALIDIWAAVKDYQGDKNGIISIYLRDYDGSSHTEIADGTVFSADWHSGSRNFVERMAQIPEISYTIVAGHELELFMVVENESDDAMWIAYDTEDYASLVQLDYLPPSPSIRYYLHDSPTPPTAHGDSQAVLTADTTAPVATTLFNYDQNRDSASGLLLAIADGDLGAFQTDSAKIQKWRTPILDSPLVITGDVLIDMWTGTIDFAQNVAGVVTMYIRDFDPNNPDSHIEMGSRDVSDADWQGGSTTFVEKTITISDVNYTVIEDHMLEIFVVVDDTSNRDMWFAYDTTQRQSVVNVPTSGGSTTIYYLHNDPTPPTADTCSQKTLPMNGTAPTATTLFNYDDSGCASGLGDTNLGEFLVKTNKGLVESDLEKYKVWRTSKQDSDLVITGDVVIDLWSSVKDPVGTDPALFQKISVFLMDFNPEIGSASVFSRDWQAGSTTFVKRTIMMANLDYTVPVGHQLEARLIVDPASDGGIWIAYDTESYPTTIKIP